ncbi:DUF3325 domain-containing protein [Pelagerythrobacter marensis]|uniref:DUF3325 domain-containing protein n=1 Tax=Pelagerythrobacter marensis TaxID=543877 RepID=A0A0G3XB86_9SPHN|nr:DUF3325 domain-containing protein [Pelagerythrobacter marensis]AKM07613.1 hypothetical protein AM2010_1543 [Pelagerythrobacter marensis]
MIHVLILFLAFLGFAMLAVAMQRHQRAIAGRQLSNRERRLMRTGGWLAIVAGLLLAMASLGPAYGAIAWLGHLSIASWGVVAVLIWRARPS